MSSGDLRKSKNKLTKQELLQWADFLYSRYDNKYRKLLLNKKLGGAIIKLDSNYDNFNR